MAGIVSKKSAESGQVVQAGQPLMAIIPRADIWVTANFKETQLADMHPGQPVTIAVDALGGQNLKGKVDSIASATGARSSPPAEHPAIARSAPPIRRAVRNQPGCRLVTFMGLTWESEK